MRYGRRRHYGGGGRGGLGLLLLGMQLLGFFNFLLRSEQFFPVTLGVLALNIVTHLRPRGFRVPWPSVQQACISVKGVWFDGQWKRLFTSPFVHTSDYHLYYNMVSFMWKAATLERHFGSVYFTYMVCVFSVATGLVYLSIHYVLAEFLDQWSHIQSCAVGFSAVIFALKVVTTHLQPAGVSLIMGFIPVPTRLACWAELVFISVLFPNVSFVGHLAGILVGMAYVYGPLQAVMDLPLALLDTAPGGGYLPDGGIPRAGSYTYRAAATGVRARENDADSNGRGHRHNRTQQEARDAEEEELQEAIRMSLQQQQQQHRHHREGTPAPSAPPPGVRPPGTRTPPLGPLAQEDSGHDHEYDMDTDVQEAIDRSLHERAMPPPPPPEDMPEPPPPFNPSYPPPSQPSADRGVGGAVRRRRGGPGGQGPPGGQGGEVDMDAVRAARVRKFERTS